MRRHRDKRREPDRTRGSAHTVRRARSLARDRPWPPPHRAPDGGTFAGPELKGKLIPGASADWQTLLSDGTALGDVRYTLPTDRGDLLYVRSRGVRRGITAVLARLARGDDVDASEYTFRTSTQIETATPDLDWLNKGIFIAEFDLNAARRDVDAHLWLPVQVARNAMGKVRPGGTLLFIGGTGGRRQVTGRALIGPITAALPALTKNLALELAPVRVNLIAVGFVDTPLAAAILGDQLDARRKQLRTTLPIRRVVGPADVAALAVHLMTNAAITGATFDIDGGQQVVEA